MVSKDLYAFFGLHDILSNHAHTPFTSEEGIDYPTVEHYYLHHQALFHDDYVSAQKILACPTASEAKRLSRGSQGRRSDLWYTKQMVIMKYGLRLKWEQNSCVRRELCRTKNKIILEANPNDTFWGVGHGKNDPRIHNPHLWRRGTV